MLAALLGLLLATTAHPNDDRGDDDGHPPRLAIAASAGAPACQAGSTSSTVAVSIVVTKPKGGDDEDEHHDGERGHDQRGSAQPGHDGPSCGDHGDDDHGDDGEGGGSVLATLATNGAAAVTVGTLERCDFVRAGGTLQATLTTSATLPVGTNTLVICASKVRHGEHEGEDGRHDGEDHRGHDGEHDDYHGDHGEGDDDGHHPPAPVCTTLSVTVTSPQPPPNYCSIEFQYPGTFTVNSLGGGVIRFEFPPSLQVTFVGTNCTSQQSLPLQEGPVGVYTTQVALPPNGCSFWQSGQIVAQSVCQGLLSSSVVNLSTDPNTGDGSYFCGGS